jgi:ADP-heptose:LPS heptosyltransferase
VTPRRPVAIPAGGFQSIAVLRLSSLGDVVLTLPAVHALRAAWPAAKLHYWVKEEFADAVRFEKAIDHVRVLEKDARKLEDLVSMSAELEACDLIVDLHGNLRTRLLAFRQRALVLRNGTYRWRRSLWVRARWTQPGAVPGACARHAEALAPLGITAAGTPRLEAGPEAERWAMEWMSDWSPGAPPVALCPGATYFTKRWPEARWCALVGQLAAAGLPRLVMSTPAERRALPALNASIERDPRARWICEPLPRCAALLSRCALAVTHDSGLMHVAAARGTRVVALFGSTSPVLGFAPAGEGHAVLCRNEPCQPCTLHGRAECPRSHFRCMQGIEPYEVLWAVNRVLATAPR